MRRLFTFTVFVVFISIYALVTGSGCANIIPPSGGPKDSFPPVLLKASPPDSTTNFRGNRIELTFDEYIDLADLSNNTLFTPSFDRNPKLITKGKLMTIEFNDTLQPNTTYILNFGNALRDINESNIYRDFTYTFSTGPYLDSLELRGNVTLAETGKVDSTLIAVLYRNLADSAVKTLRPDYISRVDAKGNFRFKNLPNTRFAVYVIEGGQGNRRYQNTTQLFAFADSTIQSGSTTPLKLYAYREEQQGNRSVTSTIGGPKLNEKRLTFTTNLTSNQQDLKNDLVMNFNTPLRVFDSSKLVLADTTYSKLVYTTALDSSRKQLTIRTKWKPGNGYHLILDKDFAEDSAGRKLLKSDTLSFKTRSEADYGQLRLRLRNIDTSQHQVLLFVQNEQVVFSVAIPGNVVDLPLFNPGEYQLRLLYDRNRNGKWDAGNFKEKRQPELVKPVDRAINVKANMDNEFDITL
jgi:hypothetical protein